jgi:hypothetical protein
MVQSPLPRSNPSAGIPGSSNSTAANHTASARLHPRAAFKPSLMSAFSRSYTVYRAA